MKFATCSAARHDAHKMADVTADCQGGADNMNGDYLPQFICYYMSVTDSLFPIDLFLVLVFTKMLANV